MQTNQECISHVNSLTFQLAIRRSMQTINKTWKFVNSYNFKLQTTSKNNGIGTGRTGTQNSNLKQLFEKAYTAYIDKLNCSNIKLMNLDTLKSLLIKHF